MDLVLRGQIMAGGDLIEDGWVAAKNGRIAEIGSGRPPGASKVHDAGDALVLPGIVDGQTHSCSFKGLKGLGGTTRSAIAGGVTTLVDMPYDNPLPLDRTSRLNAKINAIANYAHADVALYGTATSDTGTANLNALIDGGVVGFKISSFESSPTRFPRISSDLRLDLLEILADGCLPLCLHNEDQEIVLARIERARANGLNGIAAHSESRPPAAELAATGHFLALGLATGAHVHIVHLSTGAGFDLVESFSALGARATGELCVHYLWFDPENDGDALGARMKVNPPIRPGQIEPIWEAIKSGKVAFISSDHSSWPIDNKLTGSIFDAGAGVPGVETLLPAFFTCAERRGLDAARLTAEQLSARPACFFGLDDRKGQIAVGLDADLTVLERGEFKWDEALAHDGLNWSPFHGREFSVRVARTYLRGDLGWDGKEIRSQPGAGRYVPRRTEGWFQGAQAEA
ncbi:MAG: dihydroorotase family protein [Albidovulum sp.]|nr:dihydroorotase family protein [Albidovulum sp.]